MIKFSENQSALFVGEQENMFSMCSELTPRAHIPDTRIPQLMQPCFQDNVHLVNVHPGKVLRLRLPPLPLLLLEQLSHQDGESMVAINICMIAAVHCENQTLHATR